MKYYDSMTHEGTRDAVNRSNRILLSILLIGFLIRAAGLSIVPPALNSDELLKAFDSRACEARQALFTLLLAAFITLTFIGVFWRGEGMSLMIPWSLFNV